jgi:hypothetical protein
VKAQNLLFRISPCCSSFQVAVHRFSAPRMGSLSPSSRLGLPVETWQEVGKGNCPRLPQSISGTGTMVGVEYPFPVLSAMFHAFQVPGWASGQ